MPQSDIAPFDRAMVDVVKTFVWPFVKDVRKVVVGGAVKRGQRERWDALLTLPTKDREAVFDYLGEEAAILDAPWAL